MSKKTGIYMILCVENNKKYIGQSMDIITRWRQHRYTMKQGKGCNPHLQNAWNKYGQDKFVFHIIEECSQEELNSREKYFIEHYQAMSPDSGYNISCLESTITSGINRNGINFSEYHLNKPKKPVVTIDTQTGEVKELSSAKEVEGYWKRIEECLATWKGTGAKKKIWTIKGRIVMYKEDHNPDTNYLEELCTIMDRIKKEAVDKRRRPEREKIIKEVSPRKGQPVKAILIASDEERTFLNKGLMIRELGLSKVLVKRCLSPKFTNTQHKGYRFELLENSLEIS